jgi:hypothetical protein
MCPVHTEIGNSDRNKKVNRKSNESKLAATVFRTTPRKEEMGLRK